MMSNLHRPRDLEDAAAAGAACGHAALAAIAQRLIMTVYLAGERRPYMNGRDMRAAMAQFNVSYRSLWAHPTWKTEKPFPNGLVLIQLEGSWCAPGLPSGASMTHTHWIATNGTMVYDINQDGWLERELWEAETVPRLMAQYKGCTGWSVREAYECFTT